METTEDEKVFGRKIETLIMIEKLLVGENKIIAIQFIQYIKVIEFQDQTDRQGEGTDKIK